MYHSALEGTPAATASSICWMSASSVRAATIRMTPLIASPISAALLEPVCVGRLMNAVLTPNRLSTKEIR